MFNPVPGRSRAEERAVEDDAHDRAPAVGREIFGLDDEIARRVVDEDVKPPEAIDGRRHERLNGLGLADVGGLRKSFSSPLFDERHRLGERVLPTAGHDDTGAEPRQLEGDRPSEPANVSSGSIALAFRDKDHPGVEAQRAFRKHEQGIDLDLLNLRVLGRKA